MMTTAGCCRRRRVEASVRPAVSTAAKRRLQSSPFVSGLSAKRRAEGAGKQQPKLSPRRVWPPIKTAARAGDSGVEGPRRIGRIPDVHWVADSAQERGDLGQRQWWAGGDGVVVVHCYVLVVGS